MKKLVTERLILREWQDSDVEQFFLNSKNPHVGPMAGWKPHETREETQDVMKIFIERDETWAIVLKDGNRLIGSVGLHSDKSRVGIPDTYELGYVLAEEFWGRGIMYEVCREVIRFVFEEKNARILSVCHFPSNDQSKRVIQKCGFVFEGVLRQAFLRAYDGKVLDEACYSMTREEFMRNRRVNHSNDIQREMRYAVVRMTKVSARAFLEWQYKAPFEMYTCSLAALDGRLADVINGVGGKEYYAVYDSFGDLFGVYDYRFTKDKKLQIEFRMRPEMNGKGFGVSFISECIRFGKMQYEYDGTLTSQVSASNKVVCELLASMGFSETSRSVEQYYGQETEMICMELPAEN